jgi:hypothetical protein
MLGHVTATSEKATTTAWCYKGGLESLPGAQVQQRSVGKERKDDPGREFVTDFVRE